MLRIDVHVQKTVNGNMSKILQIKVDFKFMYSTSGILKGMLWSPTPKKKKKPLIDVEIINDKNKKVSTCMHSKLLKIS